MDVLIAASAFLHQVRQAGLYSYDAVFQQLPLGAFEHRNRQFSRYGLKGIT
jgi:hypothetical protein